MKRYFDMKIMNVKRLIIIEKHGHTKAKNAVAEHRSGNRSVTAGRDAALRRPDGAARRPYLSQPDVTDRLPGLALRVRANKTK